MDLNVVNKDGRCKKIVSRNCQCFGRRVAIKKENLTIGSKTREKYMCMYTHALTHTHIYIYIYLSISIWYFNFFYFLFFLQPDIFI